MSFFYSRYEIKNRTENPKYSCC